LSIDTTPAEDSLRAVTLRRPTRPSDSGVAAGGVPVAYEVAHALHAPLDLFLVRKLVSPGTRSWRWERCDWWVRILDQQLIRMYGVPAE